MYVFTFTVVYIMVFLYFLTTNADCLQLNLEVVEIHEKLQVVFVFSKSVWYQKKRILLQVSAIQSGCIVERFVHNCTHNSKEVFSF